MEHELPFHIHKIGFSSAPVFGFLFPTLHYIFFFKFCYVCFLVSFHSFSLDWITLTLNSIKMEIEIRTFPNVGKNKLWKIEINNWGSWKGIGVVAPNDFNGCMCRCAYTRTCSTIKADKQKYGYQLTYSSWMNRVGNVVVVVTINRVCSIL